MKPFWGPYAASKAALDALARTYAAETAKVISSSVYVRRDNKWWGILYQETPIK